MKVVIPVEDKKAALLSEHFGRAPFFASYDIVDGEVVGPEVVPNSSDHFGGSGNPPEKILSLGAEVVISMGMGMKAINLFQQAGVAVLKSEVNGSEEALEEFNAGNLPELTEGCLHSLDH